MHRICGSLSRAGYAVLLIGRQRKESIPENPQLFAQKRLSCFFTKGFLFYAEYNLRLFFCLLFQQADIICAVDLDTILPVYLATAIKQQKRVYDAHELFTEQKEIITRPLIHKIWLAIERFAVPEFKAGYTVNGFIAGELFRRYQVNYTVVRNLPELSFLPTNDPPKKDFLIYQGAVNEGRCFETLIPAMREINAKLLICGSGNFFKQTGELIRQYGLENKIELRGNLPPEELKRLTPQACLGIMLFEPTGLNQYHSLSNRFFDYMMAGIPQICVNYPEYAAINDRFRIACLINDTRCTTIAAAVNNLLMNDVLYQTLRTNCLKARNTLNWTREEQLLLAFYQSL